MGHLSPPKLRRVSLLRSFYFLSKLYLLDFLLSILGKDLYFIWVHELVWYLIEDCFDLILQGSCYSERSGVQVESTPPFFCGSPPSRASNPVIQDEQFGNGNGTNGSSFSPFLMGVASASPSSSARGCVRMKFGHTPAAVRIEGFDCLNRDRRNCSISAVA